MDIDNVHGHAVFQRGLSADSAVRPYLYDSQASGRQIQPVFRLYINQSRQENSQNSGHFRHWLIHHVAILYLIFYRSSKQ